MMKKAIFSLILVFGVSLLMTSCGPYKKELYEEIEPNETAFVVPLETGTEQQKKFGSEEYLASKKVAAKRVYIPVKKYSTGRMWWSYKYIPTNRVIKVDRAPITREWTDSKSTGTKTSKQDIEVESQESIGFGIGITVTASIPEEWAAKFLYNYNGRALEGVMDYNVRSYIQDLLTGEFGSRKLSTCQSERKDVFEIMKKKTTEHFATKGIRIDNIGAAGEFAYKDKSIQDAINSKFTAEMKIDAAQKEVTAAQKFSEARAEIKAQKELDADIQFKLSQANLMDGIAEGKVKLPNTIVLGGTTLDLIPLKK